MHLQVLKADVFIGASKIGRDISEHKRAEAERIRLLEENAAILAKPIDPAELVSAVASLALRVVVKSSP